MATEPSAAVDTGGELSLSDAAVLFSKRPPDEEPSDQQENEPATRTDDGADGAAQESGDEPDAGQDESPVPGDAEESDPAAEPQPSIEPPRSWSKEHKDAFAALPRHLQEVVADSERAREADFLTRTREVAESRKVHETEIAAANAARQRYEQALPLLLQTIQGEQARDFDDIKTWDDVAAMQATDPIRYQQWDLLQRRSQAVQTELAASTERQQKEVADQFVAYTKEQEKLFLEKAPEFADPKQSETKVAEARAFLAERGIPEAEQQELWNGKPLSLRDHRIQLIFRDAIAFRNAQNKLKTPAPKQQIPAQKPGTATTAAERNGVRIKDLERNLDATGKIDDALKLFKARRRVAAA